MEPFIIQRSTLPFRGEEPNFQEQLKTLEVAASKFHYLRSFNLNEKKGVCIRNEIVWIINGHALWFSRQLLWFYSCWMWYLLTYLQIYEKKYSLMHYIIPFFEEVALFLWFSTCQSFNNLGMSICWSEFKRARRKNIEAISYLKQWVWWNLLAG